MSDEKPIVEGVEAPLYLNYNFTAGAANSRFLLEIKQGRLVGQRCPSCENVFVPPRGSCAACGVATEEEVMLGHEGRIRGTLETFTIVHIPIPGNPIKPPYIVASVIPDGANLSFLHLLSECVNEEVHIGQRIEAVWRPEEEWDIVMDNIAYWRPIDEPTVPAEHIGKLAIDGAYPDA